jgi:uroporphyrinogen-III synthase
MRIGITREANQLEELLGQACARGIEVVPVPLIAIQQLRFEWPPRLSTVSPDWVLLSSAAGVSSFLDNLHTHGIALPSTVRYAAIGETTAEAIRANGLDVSFVPSEAYGSVLFTEFLKNVVRVNDIVVYARAVDVAYDPAPLFAEYGIEYIPLICYSAVSNAVDPKVIGGFDRGDYLLFTAPSAVRSYHEQFGNPMMNAVAIGHSTGSEMERQGWSGYTTLPTPEIRRILELVK